MSASSIRPPARSIRRWAAPVLLLGAVAACSGGGGKEPDRVAPRPVSADSSVATSLAAPNLTTVPEPTIAPVGGSGPAPTVKGAPVIKVTVNPGTATGFVRARADVSDVVCAPGPGRWTVSGKVENPARSAVGYRIYVAFVTAQGATRGLLQVDVERVEDGATMSWSGELALDEVSLACVLRVERFAL